MSEFFKGLCGRLSFIFGRADCDILLIKEGIKENLLVVGENLKQTGKIDISEGLGIRFSKTLSRIKILISLKKKLFCFHNSREKMENRFSENQKAVTLINHDRYCRLFRL